jgi:GNAT superfamily N-acetyltransferase
MAAEMSVSETSPVLLLSSQVEKGAEVLARAMQHSPDMKYFIGDDSRMLEAPARRFYQSVIRIGLIHGEVYTTPSMLGIAVWVSPEHNSFTFGSMFRTGFLRAIVSMGFGPLRRFVRSSIFVEKLQKQAISVPHWTLVFIGVEPAYRGKGVGGKLIQPILARADSDGMPCYVESVDERNLTFYQRHGFEIVRDGQIPNGGPHVWILVR